MQRFEIDTFLDTNKQSAVCAFLQTQQCVSVFQIPQYAAAMYGNTAHFFVSGHDENGINFFALVTSNGRKYFNIQFGPVATDSKTLRDGIAFTRKYLRYKALALTVQLPLAEAVGEKTEIPGDFYFDDKYNWSTLVLPVAASAEEQFRNLSKHHQRSVRKAEKSGITVRMINDEHQVALFADIYIRMYRHRKLYADPDSVRKTIMLLRETFLADEYATGAIWGIYADDVLAGGIVVTYTGDAAFYYMGATDPERRSLPLLHIAFMKAIDMCREKGIKYFDFGGYAAHAAPGSQEENINRFKLQFGGQLVRYLPKVYFNLVPGGTKLLRFLRWLKN